MFPGHSTEEATSKENGNEDDNKEKRVTTPQEETTATWEERDAEADIQERNGNTLDKLILASKKFHNFILATLVSLHYNICKNRVKLATYKISYLK